MDSYCTVCGEPWDVNYLLHDVTDPQAEGFTFGRHRLVVLACPCCKKKPRTKSRRQFRDCVNVLAEVLGDDVDGFAAEMEDLMTMCPFTEEPQYGKRKK